MPIFTAIKPVSLIGQALADRSFLSDNVNVVNDSSYNPSVSVLGLPVEGGVSIYLPALILNIPKSGIKSEGVNSFLYDRIIRQGGVTRQDGSPIDVGVIRESKIVSQTLWNGFNASLEVTNIAYSYATSGVTVLTPIVTDSFNPLQEKLLQLSIDIAGDPHFDVEITITFDSGATYVFSVRGDRLPKKEFTYLSGANWKGGMKMESLYLTSIYKASETSETRQTLRPSPIRKMTYEFAAVGRDYSTVLWGFLQGLAKRRSYLPLFQDGSVVTQLSTTPTIHCDTINKRYYPGNVLLIAIRRYDRSHDEGTAENEAMYFTAMISSVTDTSITIISFPLAEIPKNSIVYPGIYSEIALKDNKFEIFKPTGSIAKVTINEVFGPTTLEADNDSYSPTLFYGDAFFTFEWNWRVSPKVGLHRDAIVFKKGRYNTIIPRTEFSTASIQAMVSVHSRAEWWELTGFLNYIKGRYRAFWVKHPLDAYRLGAYTLFVGPDLVEVEVLTQGGIGNMYSIQAVWIEDSNGVEYIIKVDAIRAGVTSQSVILQLDPTAVTDVESIKRAFLVRNTSDKIVERWYTDKGVVEVKMKMIELPGAYTD